MIARIRANETLLKKRSYFKVKEKYLRAGSTQKIDFRKASEAELEVVRKMIRAELKKERRRQILAWPISIAVGIVVIYGFVRLLNTPL